VAAPSAAAAHTACASLPGVPLPAAPPVASWCLTLLPPPCSLSLPPPFLGPSLDRLCAPRCAPLASSLFLSSRRPHVEHSASRRLQCRRALCT
jgi:hypothetical protein